MGRRSPGATGDGAGSAARVAVLERRGKFLVAEPFFERGPRLVVGREMRANIGDLVVVGSGAGRNGRGRGRATVARRLGRPDVARDVIEALMVDRGLRRSFDPQVENEAQEASERGNAELGESSEGSTAELGAGTRRDLRSLPTFTVDPVSARDFDDAISATEADDGTRTVWVHIADVAAYVSPGSSIDLEAYGRGTSVYVPGAVEPMLPRALSNNVCSLVPGQDRLAVSVEMVFEDDRVARRAFHRSVIRSDERLDYDRVDRIFAGGERAQGPWGEALAMARAVARSLSARRAAEPALVLESIEPEFGFDRDGHVVSSKPVAQTEAHRMIEHLMIAANEQVAGLLEARRIPTLYRVHERPDGAAAERLVAQLASLGVPTPPTPRGAMSSQQAADLVGEASQLVERWVTRTGRGRRALSALVLRALKQAYYDHRNIGHAGLRSPRYCHFTSPIRRYPDLICHRALLSAITNDVPPPDPGWVASAGPWTSGREREAMMIERDADDVAQCFLLERELAHGDPQAAIEGEVVGLIGSGAFVAFGAGGSFEGMLPVRRLQGDWWELNEEGTILHGVRRGGAIRLGDPLRVHVDRVDPPRGRVDLVPAWEED